MLLSLGNEYSLNVWATGAAAVVDQALALRSSSCERVAAAVVAGLRGGRVSVPRKVEAPPTSSVVAGLATLMPIPEVPWTISELPCVSAPVHNGTVPSVPEPVTVPEVGGVIDGAGTGVCADSAAY